MIPTSSAASRDRSTCFGSFIDDENEQKDSHPPYAAQREVIAGTRDRAQTLRRCVDEEMLSSNLTAQSLRKRVSIPAALERYQNATFAAAQSAFDPQATSTTITHFLEASHAASQDFANVLRNKQDSSIPAPLDSLACSFVDFNNKMWTESQSVLKDLPDATKIANYLHAAKETSEEVLNVLKVNESSLSAAAEGGHKVKQALESWALLRRSICVWGLDYEREIAGEGEDLSLDPEDHYLKLHRSQNPGLYDASGLGTDTLP